MEFLGSSTLDLPRRQADSGLFPMSLRLLLSYRWCDTLSEPLIYLMVIFSPWAFGTTEKWSCWVMNGLGYTLGVILVIKLGIRWVTGYAPERWDQVSSKEGSRMLGRRLAFFKRAVAVLSILTLGYCFISALNARSDFVPQEYQFASRPFVPWLPHSYDAGSSWFAFFNYLAIGLAFWAFCDWILGKTPRDLRETNGLPERLRRLLWVMTINGGLLAIEGIVQRVSGSNELLFLKVPHVHMAGVAQFGPYAYRSNASQYFGLLWPLCVGFWWTEQKSRAKGRLSHVILVCAMLMALCPLICTSRMGLFVTVPALVFSGFIVARAKGMNSGARNGMLVGIGLVLVAAFFLGWQRLAPRLGTLEEDLEGRNAIYEVAQNMSDEHPIFGTGPGTFENIFSIFRKNPEDDWYAQAHNDWLETLVTFGWIGSFLIGLSFLMVFLRWWAPGGIRGGRRFPIFIWIGLASCIAHARFDFPFQVYSVLFLFFVLCAILFSLSSRPMRG